MRSKLRFKEWKKGEKEIMIRIGFWIAAEGPLHCIQSATTIMERHLRRAEDRANRAELQGVVEGLAHRDSGRVSISPAWCGAIAAV